MIFAGIDIGSITAKAALIKGNNLIATHTVSTGFDHLNTGNKVFDAVLEKTGFRKKDIRAIVSTGYGRSSVSFADKSMTEILCHGTGAHFLNPDIRGIIDVGGQDSKAILLDNTGQVADFAMNDKCAAGTGRFLEAMARALQVPIDTMSELDRGATQNLTLSSMCTVFAESEVVSLIADGIETNEIVNGLNRSIASRTVSLVKRVAPKLSSEKVAMSGGVAKNSGVVRALSQMMGKEIFIPDQPDTIGALGAALIALEKSV